MVRIDGCRICGNPGIEQVLSLGDMPLVNSLVAEQDLEGTDPTYPLEFAFCSECALAQITETVPPQILFSDYTYFSSFSDTMLDHSKRLAGELIESRGLDSHSLVMEIASNDGYLLQYYKQAGIPVLGIEPAANVAKVAIEERGIPTECEFFGLEFARVLQERGELADVMHAHNVLAHVADLHGFVEGIHTVLKHDGIAVVEVPYLRELIEKCEFDTIYHEHLCYFSLTPLKRLFEQHGLTLANVELVPIHGGSLRLFVARTDANALGASSERMLWQEAEWGVSDILPYSRFADRVKGVQEQLVGLLNDLKKDRRRLVAYGAAAKGCVLLNSCGIGRDILDYLVDRSTHKQGLYMPTVRLPIYPPEKLLEDKPDYVLILPWNIKEEIMEQMSHVREWGGRFILPIPSAEIL